MIMMISYDYLFVFLRSFEALWRALAQRVTGSWARMDSSRDLRLRSRRRITGSLRSVHGLRPWCLCFIDFHGVSVPRGIFKSYRDCTATTAEQPERVVSDPIHISFRHVAESAPTANRWPDGTAPHCHTFREKQGRTPWTPGTPGTPGTRPLDRWSVKSSWNRVDPSVSVGPHGVSGSHLKLPAHVIVHNKCI